MPIFNEEFYSIRLRGTEECLIKAAGRLKRDRNYSIERDNSDTLLAACVIAGELHLYTQGKTISVQSGESFFIGNRNWYKLHASQNNPPELIWMNFCGSVPKNLSEIYFQNDFAVAGCDISKDIMDTVQCCSDDDAAVFIHKILLKIKKSIKSAEHLLKPDTIPEAMKRYITNSIQTPFSLKKMAEDFYVSPSTINRIFVNYFGCTPYQYYQQIRFEIAQSMLRNTQMTIDEIAASLNFFDRNHFTVFFTSKGDVPPSAYRKKQK